MDRTYLTPRDIASLLSLSQGQVQHLIEGEAFPFNRYHRRVIVKLEDLVKFLAGQSTMSRQRAPP